MESKITRNEVLAFFDSIELEENNQSETLEVIEKNEAPQDESNNTQTSLEIVNDQVMNDEIVNDDSNEVVNDQVETQSKSPYKQAAETLLFDEQGNVLADYKGIVNKENIQEVFSVTSKGYKIIQHEDVLTKIEAVVNDLKLKHNRHILQMNDGARIHAWYNFPEIKFKVDDREISLNCSWDNSYNQTTGVRMLVGAFYGGRISLYLGEKFSKYYHKHTIGLNTSSLVRNLEKGIKVFEDKVKDYFESMTKKMFTYNEAIILIDEAIKEKILAEKYGKQIKDTLDQEVVVDLKNERTVSQWKFYLLVSEVLEKNVTSLDTRNRYSDLLQKRMANKK